MSAGDHLNLIATSCCAISCSDIDITIKYNCTFLNFYLLIVFPFFLCKCQPVSFKWNCWSKVVSNGSRLPSTCFVCRFVTPIIRIRYIYVYHFKYGWTKYSLRQSCWSETQYVAARTHSQYMQTSAVPSLSGGTAYYAYEY